MGGHSLDKYKSITVTELTAAYTAFANDSEVISSGSIQNPDSFNNCLDTHITSAERQSYCGDATVFGLIARHRVPDNAAAQTFAAAMARFDVRSGLYDTIGKMDNLYKNISAYAE
jgi:hypothetical protein